MKYPTDFDFDSKVFSPLKKLNAEISFSDSTKEFVCILEKEEQASKYFLFFKGIEIRRCGGLCLLLLRVSRWKKEKRTDERARGSN